MTTRYTASVQYNDTTVYQLSSIVNRTFKMQMKVFYLVLCIGLVVAGVLIGFESPAGIMCIAFGCMLLPSMNAAEKSQAKQTIRQMNGNTVDVRYEFGDDGFACLSGKERNEFTYDSIIRMVEEREYLYLFPNMKQAYMIRRESIRPTNEEAFRAFIAERVGLQWTKPVHMAALSLKQIRFNRENTRSN